jgi:hypothetical protein
VAASVHHESYESVSRDICMITQMYLPIGNDLDRACGIYMSARMLMPSTFLNSIVSIWKSSSDGSRLWLVFKPLVWQNQRVLSPSLDELIYMDC